MSAILEEEYETGRLLWRNGGSEARRAVERHSGRAVSLLWPAGKAAEPEKLRCYLESLPSVEGVLRYRNAARDRHKRDVLVAEDLDSSARVLSDVLSTGGLRAREARRFADQALRLVARCHDAGQALGPLRPRRFLLASRPAWGLRVIPSDPPRGGKADAMLTTNDEWLGWMYLPPEAYKTSDLGPSSEVYSLVAVLHTALTGEFPFPKSAARRSITISKEIRAGYLSEGAAPPEWRQLLRRGMALDLAERPSASELLHLLPSIKASA